MVEHTMVWYGILWYGKLWYLWQDLLLSLHSVCCAVAVLFKLHKQVEVLNRKWSLSPNWNMNMISTILCTA